MKPRPDCRSSLVLFTLFAALFASSAIAQIQAPDDAIANGAPVFEATAVDELIALEGKRVVVTGTVSRTGKAGSGTNFVNYEGTDFNLVTFKSDLVNFEDGEPADIYPSGTRLVITGVISIYKDKPQFKLASQEGVKVLEDGEDFPPPTPKESEPEMKKIPETGKPDSKPTESEEKGPKKPPVDPSKYFK